MSMLEEACCCFTFSFLTLCCLPFISVCWLQVSRTGPAWGLSLYLLVRTLTPQVLLQWYKSNTTATNGGGKSAASTTAALKGTSSTGRGLGDSAVLSDACLKAAVRLVELHALTPEHARLNRQAAAELFTTLLQRHATSAQQDLDRLAVLQAVSPAEKGDQWWDELCSVYMRLGRKEILLSALRYVETDHAG